MRVCESIAGVVAVAAHVPIEPNSDKESDQINTSDRIAYSAAGCGPSLLKVSSYILY